MSFRFEKSSCVVAGTFNMYILHPAWLTRREIVPQDQELFIESNLTQPGFRYRFPHDGTTWMISPSRVVIESTDETTNCGAYIAKILRALPETPLMAVGSNATFTADLSAAEKLSQAIQNFPCKDSLHLGESVEQRTFHVGVKRDEHRVANIQLALQPKSLTLLCNCHTKLEQREDANVAAIEAAEKFLTDRTYAKDLSHHFFEVAFDR